MIGLIAFVLVAALLFISLIVAPTDGRRVMPFLVAIGIVIIGAIYLSRQDDGFVPTPDGDIAGDRIDRSALFGETCKGHSMTLAVVGAHWCGYCRKMDAETFSDPAVKEAIKNDGFVQVHEENNPSAIQELQVEGYPTTIVLDGKCREVHRIRGFRDADEFLQELRAVRPTL